MKRSQSPTTLLGELGYDGALLVLLRDRGRYALPVARDTERLPAGPILLKRCSSISTPSDNRLTLFSSTPPPSSFELHSADPDLSERCSTDLDSFERREVFLSDTEPSSSLSSIARPSSTKYHTSTSLCNSPTHSRARSKIRRTASVGISRHTLIATPRSFEPTDSLSGGLEAV